MNINDLTIGQAKELLNIFSGQQVNALVPPMSMIGKKVIVRTYSAGVFFGALTEKCEGEVILEDARRLWYWKAKSGISLSSVAIHGIDESKSKIVESVQSIWLQPIEIIPCSKVAIDSIEGAENVKAG